MDAQPTARSERPSWPLAAAVSAVLTLGMAFLQVSVYSDRIIPLTYALLLLVAFWHRDRTLLWGMTGCFMLVSAAKLLWILPEEYYVGADERLFFFAMRWLNVLAVSSVIHLVINYRERLERSNETLADTNTELETANEELTAREEEITRQNEELQSQAEELEQQAEELRVQTEELETLNVQLTEREKTLHTLLQLSSTAATEEELWQETCSLAQAFLGDAAPAVMVLEWCDGHYCVRGHEGIADPRQLPPQLPAEGMFAELIRARNTTGQIDDIGLRPDLTLPAPTGGEPFRAALSAPVRLHGRAIGVIEIYADQPRSWEPDQARLLDWLARQCSIALEGIHLRNDLQQINDRLAWVLEATGVGLWLNTLPLGRLDWDRRTRELFFAPEGVEPTIELFDERLHPDDREPTRMAMEAAVRDRTTYAIDHRVVHPTTGEVRWLHSAGRASYAADGTPYRFDGINYDITAQKEAERRLKDSEQRLALAASAGQVGIFDWNLNDGSMIWTTEHAALFGYPSDEAPTTALYRYEEWAQRVHPDDLPGVERRLEQSLADCSPYEAEYRVVWPDGSIHWIAARGVPELDDGGQCLRMRGAVVDMTDHKRLEEELRRARDLAEEASLAKSRFVANISHELRTPMNSILGMLALVLGRVEDPASKDCLETARESADLLLALLDDLLDSAKIEAGKLDLEAAPFSLRGVIEQTTRAFAVRASEKGLVFGCRAPPDMPDAVVGDAVRLRQVLFNLIGNAIKFTETGEVQLSIQIESRTAEAASLRFAVRDTGIGLAPEDIERIFQPFGQNDPSMSRRFGGTGLGLSICTSLVTMMGSRIEADSRPGEGSTFHFAVSLPLADEVPPPKDTEINLPETAMAQLHILLAEDNRANQKLASYILQDRGHTLEIAGDGREALQRVQRNEYDVILMDVQMPGMDGFAATEAIRALPGKRAQLPIIAMTAHAAESDRQRCLECGMNDYLCKPINGREMIALVERVANILPAPVPRAPVERKAADDDAAVLNPEEGVRRCYNKPEMFEAMVDCFFTDRGSLLPQMHQALERGDLTEVGQIGHRLKGTVVYLGADRAREAAARLERFAYQEGAAVEAAEAVQVLEREIEVLSRALLAYRARGTTDAGVAKG